MTDPTPKVVSLDDFRPHVTGAAGCFGCGHKWQVVAPVGVTELECPACRTMKGRTAYECVRADEKHWTCACGCALFSVTPRGVYCPNCGDWQRPRE